MHRTPTKKIILVVVDVASFINDNMNRSFALLELEMETKDRHSSLSCGSGGAEQSTVCEYDDITSVDNCPKRSTVHDRNLHSHEDFFRDDSENVALGYDAPHKQREDGRAPLPGSSSVTRRGIDRSSLGRQIAARLLFPDSEEREEGQRENQLGRDLGLNGIRIAGSLGETDTISVHERVSRRQFDAADMVDSGETSGGVEEVETRDRIVEEYDSQDSHESADAIGAGEEHEATASPRASEEHETTASPRAAAEHEPAASPE
ncbi:hypothetical protein R1sor_012208 [Riccia sorocarpa]|uniref:Uncharacterized protein n=1 Tax=Riccia sorocarpa TaxID=122646 RepID=A0ABD3I353_9MARC